jgi:hypothetical protein
MNFIYLVISLPPPRLSFYHIRLEGEVDCLTLLIGMTAVVRAYTAIGRVSPGHVTHASFQTIIMLTKCPQPYNQIVHKAHGIASSFLFHARKGFLCPVSLLERYSKGFP